MFVDRGPSPTSSDSKLTLRKLGCPTKASPDALNITLFRDAGGAACGWFIGPLTVRDGRATLQYLPPCAETHAAVAVVRAVEAGRSTGCAVCVIDPENLWDGVWRV